WRWNLPHLTPRDAPGSSVGNLAEVLDFAHPNPSLPALPVPILPVLNACLLSAVPQRETQWHDLRASPLLRHWHL
ncbi:MAG TPA: hypothetical protein VHN14_32565, partial [Kofleriaceae bacterium]|nr:hypothetical protein [Kofleriaceae bacterium]